MKNNKFKNIRLKNRLCYYFHDIIKFEDFDFCNILIDKKSCENILILTYKTLYEILIGPKSFCIRFN